MIKHIKDADRNALVSLVDKLKVTHKDSVIIFVGGGKDSIPVVCSVNGNAQKAYRAGDLVKSVATILGGSGGGRPDFASGAGKDASKISEAIESAKGLVK